MEFKEYADKEDNIIGSPEASNNIKTEFTELLHAESKKAFTQPSKRILFISFVGTIKHLKTILYGKDSN